MFAAYRNLHIGSPPAYCDLTRLKDSSSKLILPPQYCTKTPSPKEFIMASSGHVDRSTTKSSAGALGIGKKPIELSIGVADNLVFLYPNATPENINGADEGTSATRPRAIFIVETILKIPEGVQKPPPIESLTVQLRGLESLGFPNSALEQNELIYATAIVRDAISFQALPGNAYRWETPIEVDHDVAPYERMRFGRVYQRMKISLKWEGNTSFLSKYKNMEVERDVWMTCIPNVSNALDYARTHRTIISQFGPVIIHVRTYHLTVGGYLRIGLSLPTVDTAANIVGMQLAILQSTTLYSRKRPGQIVPCKTERLQFLHIEGEELKQKMTQQNLANWAARIPTCERLRPSTLDGSMKAAIRLNHHIEVRIIFRPVNGGDAENRTKDEPLVYTAKWPVTLPSCSARWRSLKLPSYSKYDPSPIPDGVGEDGPVDLSSIAFRGRLRSHLDQTDCSCGIPWKDLLHHEDEFDDMQHTCATRLLTQELLSAASSQIPWPRQNSASSVHSGIGELGGEEDNVIDSPPPLDQATILDQKASQEYMHTD